MRPPNPKRPPLWQKTNPVRASDRVNAVSKFDRVPVVAIAEPALFLGPIFASSIAEAAELVGVTRSAITESMRTGHRAGGRLWWYANRPLIERPPAPKILTRLPVIVGDRIYPSSGVAAKELGLSVGAFDACRRRGHLPYRRPFRGLPVEFVRQRL